MPRIYRIKPLRERFLSKVEKTPSCWIWKTGKFANGYGMFNIKKIPKKAHRVSWQIHNGPIPDGKLVLHNCPSGDRKDCVNPDHLWLGTQLDNVHDRDAKGRQAKGERFSFTKLTSEKVLKIRKAYSLGSCTYQSLADQYGVCDSLIQQIVKRKCWKHL